jgi:tetratricopeptide (TPR) repeat protein
VGAYLAVVRAAADAGDLERARETLRQAGRDAIRGARAPTPAPFPETPGSAAAAGAPVFAPARYAGGFARAARGQVQEAVARLREAAARDPLMAAGGEGMQQGTDALRRGSLRMALAAFQRAVDRAPESSEAHRMLATAHAIAGDPPASIRHLETAVRLRPDDERSWLALAGVHADAGAIAGAIGVLERAIAAVPDSGGLRWRSATFLVRADRGGEALERYRDAEALPPISGEAQVHEAVATLAALQQDLPVAAAAAERRVRVSPNDPAAHRDLAGVRTKQGRPEEAFAELAIAAWLEPGDPLTLVALGHAFMADQRDGDAIAAFERAVMLQPGLREARYGLAQALMRASRRDDARQHLEEFGRQRAEAAAREQRALDTAAARADAARMSAGGRHREAVQIWQRLIAVEPGTAAHYLGLAEALAGAGALEESLQYFVKTAELDGVADVHLRLAEVLARLGRSRESALARDTYERLRLEDFRRRARR